MQKAIEKLKKVLRDPQLAIRFGKFVLKRAAIYAISVISGLLWSLIALFSKRGVEPAIRNLGADDCTPVDSFWGEHTVVGPQLARVKTAYQSKRYLEWRFTQYPLFRDLMQMYGNHDNEVVLDYGCGPGNDVVGFLIYTNASKVIGVDVSAKALRFASRRIALHRLDQDRCELISISDSDDKIPLDDNSVDYIYSEGVLHHISNPEPKIREFHRILQPGSHACIMVYNADSVWLHLYVAYEQMILRERFQGMDLYEAFAKTTDTEECPISRCYKPEEFLCLCKDAGFNAVYAGGYLSKMELRLLKKYLQSAIRDERLADEHKQFLESLTLDEHGLPQYQGKHAGIGGVYRLNKESK